VHAPHGDDAPFYRFFYEMLKLNEQKFIVHVKSVGRRIVSNISELIDQLAAKRVGLWSDFHQAHRNDSYSGRICIGSD
jgi:hypothetical protein